MTYVWNGWSQMKGETPNPSPLLSSALVPWRRWMRRWCGRRSCPRWTPHRCPSSPRPPPRTARPCPPSGGRANCWAAARGAAVATAGPPARPPPPLPSPPRPAGGRWRAAALAGWTGSIPGRVEGGREHQWRGWFISVSIQIMPNNSSQHEQHKGQKESVTIKFSTMYVSTALIPSVQQQIHVIVTTLPFWVSVFDKNIVFTH